MPSAWQRRNLKATNFTSDRKLRSIFKRAFHTLPLSRKACKSFETAVGDGVMASHRSRHMRFLFYVLACVFICAAFASELPEQLTLTSDTSNDYTLRSSTGLKNIQALSSLREGTGPFVIAAPSLPSRHLLPRVPASARLQAQSLFIRHSVLRT